MQTVKHQTSEFNKPTEMERLELVEKKVEIQKKRLEIKKEKISMSKIALEKEKEHLDLLDKKVSIQTKELENKKAELDMEEIHVNRIFDADRMLNDKIFSVLIALVSKTIDDERTIMGSEPFYTPLIKGKHRDIALNKLMDLITKL
jgi:hypothetical protein